MSFSITLQIGSETRTIGETDFPLALGGSSADIPLPGVDLTGPAAWVGHSEGRVFIQTGEAGVVVSCNGSPVATSQWLQGGDVLRIGETRIVIDSGAKGIHLRVDHIVTENVTRPPRIVQVKPEQAEYAQPGTLIRPVPFEPRPLSGSRRSRMTIRPATILILASMVVLGGLAWFLFTARSIRVEIEPPPDHMAIRGRLTWIGFGEFRLLRPGRYMLMAGKAGYHDLKIPLEVTRESDPSFRFVLEKLPGLLAIDATPVEGARVRIDGEEVGTTPLGVLELSSGEHGVEVLDERYKSFSTMVDIQGERVTQTLRVELSPRWAAITFNSIPTGATLMVGDDRAGVTPLTVDLLAGRHSIRMDLERFKPHSARVEVEAETPYTLPTVRLVPQDGRVALKSMPSGATVTVGGHYRGVTPVSLSLSPDRSHEIVVSRAGHDSASRTVRLTPGEVREMLIPLVAREGDVTVSAIPRDAQLFIDGEPRGSANQTLRLIAVPHRFEIRKEGYVPYDTTVTPQPGFPESIEVTLKTPEQIKAEATPRVIKSPGGDTLVLVDGGRIRMGAPRREPGRRANETTREVELTRPFYVATTEVSNRQYQEFDGEHVSGKVGPYNLEIGHHPVVRVSWEQAAQYCNWLSARESLPPAYVRMNGKLVGARPLTTGYRLPTESEWSLVARFPDGGAPLKYPWGSSLPIPPDSGNYADLSADEILSNSLSGYDDRFPTTAPVESFRPNSIGLFNLGGNVAEWIHDVYMIYPSGAGRVERDPTGPPNGELHVIRGSSWMDSSVSELRLSFRDYGRKGRPDVGFRVARYLE